MAPRHAATAAELHVLIQRSKTAQNDKRVRVCARHRSASNASHVCGQPVYACLPTHNRTPQNRTHDAVKLSAESRFHFYIFISSSSHSRTPLQATFFAMSLNMSPAGEGALVYFLSRHERFELYCDLYGIIVYSSIE